MEKKKKVKARTVYAAGLNLSGLWSKKPIKVYYDADLRCWYDASENLSVERMGYHQPFSWLKTYASTSKADVQTWIDGVSAAFCMLKNWIELDAEESEK